MAASSANTRSQLNPPSSLPKACSEDCWDMASPGFHDAQALIAKVKILINAQLKSVLKKVGLPVSGVKAAMQERIIARKLHLCLERM